MEKIQKTIGDICIIFFISICFVLGFEYGFRFSKSIYKKTKLFNDSKDLIKAFDNKYTYLELEQIKKESNPELVYIPWVQLGIKDHKNSFSESNDNLRKTLEPNLSDIQNCNIKKNVWFFGGSTTYGVGVPWENTIPSNFVKSIVLPSP